MWFDCKTPRENALARVFCLPYAGGDGSVVFRNWEQKMPPFVEVHTLTLPGRGFRLHQRFQTDFYHVAEILAQQVHDVTDNDGLPFFVVGYSLGSLIGFEMCRFLQQLHHSYAPVHTFFAGHIAPMFFTDKSQGEEKLYQLSDAKFRLALQRYNMVDALLLADDEFCKYFLPIIRADLELDEKYVFSPVNAPIQSNLSLFSGENDVAAPQEQMQPWKSFFDAKDDVKIQGYEGMGHEFLIERGEELRECISREIITKYLTDPWPIRVVDKAARTPNQIAVSMIQDDEVVHVTLAEFVADAQALASWMYEEAGVRPGDRILLMAESSYESFLAMLTCGLMGVVYAPSPPDMTQADLENRLENLSPTLILLCEHSNVEEQLAESDYDCPIFHAKDIDYRTYLNIGRYPVLTPYERITLEDPCFVAHTSGSTGLPKPILLYHKNVLNNLHWRSYTFPMNGNKDCYGISIFWFWYFMLPLMNDYRIAPIPQTDMLNVEVYLDKMLRLGVTHIEISPTYAGLMSKVGMGHDALKNLSLLVLMGEVVHLETVKQFQLAAPRCRITNIYSLSETNDITYCMLNKQFLHKMEVEYPEISAAPIGTPAWNIDIYLKRDDESLTSIGHVLKTMQGREVCEMFIESEALMIQGYINNESANKKSLVDSADGNKLFRCNDLVTILQKDPVILVVTGRADRTINVRGARVGLDRVTGIIKKLAEVKDCALVWNPETQQLFCFAVLECGGDKSGLDVVREQLSELLTAPETPSRFVVVPELPLNKRTKVDMRRLREMLIEEQRSHQERVLSEDPVIARVETVWMELLHTSDFDLTDDFFNVGGHSLLVVQLASSLKLPVPDVMDKRTILEQAELIKTKSDAKVDVFQLTNREPKGLDSRIAVVGLAGRWPNAVTKDQLWSNLLKKEDCFSELSENEMLQAGVPKELFSRPDWVRRAAVIPPEYVECFDAAFWNMSERDSRIIDPNQRVMMEMAYEALEDAGYAPFDAGNIGVFASGAALPTYLQNCLKHELGDISMVQLTDPGMYVQVELGNDKDYVPTRVSYNLNLTGPSKNIQSACSSGLVCVSEAVQSLRAGRCDGALAGAISITCPMKTGYLYQEGMVFSKDGTVRPFDADASGTIFTNGGTVVHLKRLEDAIRDRDHIYSVIQGIADNNDGHRGKKAYAAPSVQGQSEVIAAAYNDARIHPENISYLECHGTGTLVGDPIELEGLSKVFNGVDHEISIGSMKANIGHANSAAGICSFGKLQMMFERQTIPGQINLEKTNPGINFQELPFHVPREKQHWEGLNGARIAGISSFGMGGTNAHAVCEEYRLPASVYDLPSGIVTLSAKTAESLRMMQTNLERFLTFNERDINIGNVSFTLTTGRNHFEHRLALVGEDIDDVALSLSEAKIVEPRKPKIVLVFPGQGGAKYENCGADLHHNFPFVQRIINEAINILGYDFRDGDLGTTRITQVCVFVHGYCTWMILKKLGLEADIALGHSVGELVAATVAGLFSFKEGLLLVDHRGQLMDTMDGSGKMATFFASAEVVEEAIAEFGSVSIACYNAPEITVVSGPECDVAQAVEKLNAQGVKGKLLNTSSAFHSSFVTSDMVSSLAKFVSGLTFGEPDMQLLSNISGSWIQANRFELCNPRYWASHMRQPVKWVQQVETLKREFADERLVFVECGPGKSICSLLKRNGVAEFDWHLAHTMRHPKATTNDVTQLQQCVADIWRLGADIDFNPLFTEDFRAEKVQRVSLPTYQFDRKHCWVGPSDLAFASDVVYETVFEPVDVPALETIRHAVVCGDSLPTGLPFQSVDVSDLPSVLETIGELWFVGSGSLKSITEISNEFLEVLKLIVAADKKLDVNVLVLEGAAAYSSLAGMAKTLALESSLVRVRLLEWDFQGAVPDVSAVDALEFRSVHTDTAVSRLRKVPAPGKMREMDPNAWYVITGGTRGLGFGLAEHLFETYGLANLVLVGRSDLSGEYSQKLLALRSRGGNVELFKTDICDAEALPYAEEIKGIFHCAGVLRDSLIMNSSQEDLALVLGVKLAVVNLLEQCSNAEFAVFFSSTSSLFGAGGQVSYAGANSCLDFLARQKSHLDLYSIQWAGWKDIGMSVDTDLKELSGERHISPKVGYQALDSVLAFPSGVYSVMDIVSWDAFAANSSVFPHAHHSARVQKLLTATTPSKASKPTDLRQFIISLTGTSDFDVSLYSLGFDSLDIVNFRNRVQANFDVSVPLTTYLDQNSTVRELLAQMQADQTAI